MLFNFLALALGVVGIVYSQSLNGLPDCAKTCVTQFTSGSNIGGCPSLDVACICSSAGFLQGIACCLAGTCDAADQATSVAFAQSLCKSAGVTNLPAAVSCPSSSGAAPSTSGTSAASAATGGSTSTTATTGTSISASSTGSAASTGTSAAASAAKNEGPQNVANVGAGLLGLAAVVLI